MRRTPTGCGHGCPHSSSGGAWTCSWASRTRPAPRRHRPGTQQRRRPVIRHGPGSSPTVTRSSRRSHPDLRTATGATRIRLRRVGRREWAHPNPRTPTAPAARCPRRRQGRRSSRRGRPRLPRPHLPRHQSRWPGLRRSSRHPSAGRARRDHWSARPMGPTTRSHPARPRSRRSQRPVHPHAPAPVRTAPRPPPSCGSPSGGSRCGRWGRLSRPWRPAARPPPSAHRD